ncbi:bifunctional phosphoribosyl-AMP cyclohydrolase/phosphoribosyl-ATP diphosphatase HisIE [Evansella cellulosilytica]|uniref:Histidine biosynthesis bifunctional protein HisIE n=1 Tax=Evansella cellulosilytica (strain ATCC 21833 / DSM 2522 / FERM P-1141 / JCM 9156 / N-4) TaxID=649639 RepID=E6TRE4_EVAC2|nr:bifunctional phosphoribosyl-AMP cyclohydrolase/phosphoribosyl-ATP diphosphatase HisIE [Evansella cellulosilytica]ADU31774.1 phosphoribosyl-ATP diphosphatase [Evansella cellulosilytica DSM 2522]
MTIEVRFDEKGLVPAIVQDAQSKEVLTLAYMNKESLEKTLETKETWFYSRSRQELWHKGATSGNTQRVVDIRVDCDEDALVVLVEPNGPACHEGSFTCFTDRLNNGGSETSTTTISDGEDRFAIIRQLEQVIAERATERPEGSYTTYLFDEGVDKILKKVGEEASEVIIAAKNRSKEELTWESADLLYHWLVLLREQQLPLDAVLQRLAERHGEK